MKLDIQRMERTLKFIQYMYGVYRVRHCHSCFQPEDEEIVDILSNAKMARGGDSLTKPLTIMDHSIVKFVAIVGRRKRDTRQFRIDRIVRNPLHAKRIHSASWVAHACLHRR